MMSEEDILLDESMSEINDILENAKDWQEALEEIAENNQHLSDKQIVKIVTTYFFKDEKSFLEEKYAG